MTAVANPQSGLTTVRVFQSGSWRTLTRPYSATGFVRTWWSVYTDDGLIYAGWSGTLGEARLYDRPLPNEELDLLESEMQSKWAF